MLEMSWITAILQLYSQVTDLLGNVIVKHINMRVFNLLARFHYILNLPRMSCIITEPRSTTQNDFSGQFFRIFEIKLFCFVVAVRDLVHGVEGIHLTYINC